jgi:hypothetical protein
MSLDQVMFQDHVNQMEHLTGLDGNLKITNKL